MINKYLSYMLVCSLVFCLICVPTASATFSCGAPSFGMAKSFGLGGKMKGPTSVVVGDFNGDDNVDLVAANLLDGNLSILTGDGKGGFGAVRNIGLGNGLTSIAAGDLNGDGKLDLVVGGDGTDDMGVVLGDGTGGFGGLKLFQVGGDAGFVTLGDLNGDGNSIWLWAMP